MIYEGSGIDFSKELTLNELEQFARDSHSIYGVPLRDVPLSVVVQITGAPSVLLCSLARHTRNKPDGGVNNGASHSLSRMPAHLTASVDRFVRLGENLTPFNRIMGHETDFRSPGFPYLFNFLSRTGMLGYDPTTCSGRNLSEVESRLMVNDYGVFDDPGSVESLLDSEVRCNPAGLNNVTLVGVEKRQGRFFRWYNGGLFIPVIKDSYSVEKFE